jgi:hypothetical protein
VGRSLITSLRRARRALRRLTEISASERRLLVSALLVLSSMRVALWVTSTPWLLRNVLGRDTRRAGPSPDVAAADVGLAVRRAARMVPYATCLPQALAVIWMLAGRGHAGALRIGVKRGTAGELVAHAWVEHENRIIIGNHGVKQYAVLPSLEGALWLR